MLFFDFVIISLSIGVLIYSFRYIYRYVDIVFSEIVFIVVSPLLVYLYYKYVVMDIKSAMELGEKASYSPIYTLFFILHKLIFIYAWYFFIEKIMLQKAPYRLYFVCVSFLANYLLYFLWLDDVNFFFDIIILGSPILVFLYYFAYLAWCSASKKRAHSRQHQGPGT
jgi:hypothetical protein